MTHNLKKWKAEYVVVNRGEWNKPHNTWFCSFGYWLIRSEQENKKWTWKIKYTICILLPYRVHHYNIISPTGNNMWSACEYLITGLLHLNLVLKSVLIILILSVPWFHFNIEIRQSGPGGTSEEIWDTLKLIVSCTNLTIGMFMHCVHL